MKFMDKWKTWFTISGVILLIGLLSLLIPGRGLNLGIDFTGGNMVTLEFARRVSETEIRDVLQPLGLGRSSIQMAENVGASTTAKQTVIIQTPPLDETQKAQVLDALEEKVGSFVKLGDEAVDAAFSQELRQKAFFALLIASIGMVAYITVRFEFRFAIAAILALLHDSLIIVGIFSLLQFPISSSFVAAILTIIGYSVNDTIVIFDRIRENLKVRQREPLRELVDSSILETLPRSINTALTTLFTVTAVLILGGTTLREFSLALVLGIIVGTYSSIFIASPFWVLWKENDLKRLRLAGKLSR